MNTASSGNQAVLALIGRVVVAAVFILSGVAKLGSPGAVQVYIASVGLPAPLLGYIISLIVEIGGGALLLVGYHEARRRSAGSLLCDRRISLPPCTG